MLMKVKLVSKIDPTETVYTIELGEGQLRNLYRLLCRHRLTPNSHDRLSYEILETELKEILNASPHK